MTAWDCKPTIPSRKWRTPAGPYDELLRATVYAFPVDATFEERSAAAKKVVDTHALLPLIAVEHAIGIAEADVRVHEDEELAWYDAIPTVGRAR